MLHKKYLMEDMMMRAEPRKIFRIKKRIIPIAVVWRFSGWLFPGGSELPKDKTHWYDIHGLVDVNVEYGEGDNVEGDEDDHDDRE